ncbi:ATP-grasp domain-containing protein [Micromonospora peucetia]|uniref:ATP-grasp domain-containing protein n=1 Tax=Micromonospora peucetia TaxID=47871 RepID=UPI0033198900
MRVGILGWDRDEPESHSLVRVGLDRRHDVTLFTLDDIRCRESATGPITQVDGVPASDFDVVLSRAEIRPDRVQADYERYALLCAVPGLRVLDPLDAYFAVENKTLTLQRLANAGLPIVPTITCRNFVEVREALAEWGTVVIKPSFSYGGTDVERITGSEADRHIFERLLKTYNMVICQPYVPHPDGDFRITVVGDQAVLNFQRVPARDDWRANTMQGATVREAEPPAELIELAVQATRTAGITVSGLDFVPSPDGWRILEINNTPGWALSALEDQRRTVEAIYEFVESDHARR